MTNSIFTVILSTALFVLSVYTYKKINPSVFSRYSFVFLIVSWELLFITYLVAYYFTGNGIDEATIFHLEYGLDGAGFFEYTWLIVITIAILLSLTYLFWLILKDIDNQTLSKVSRLSLSAPYILLLLSLLLNPAIIDLFNLRSNSLIFDEQLDSTMSANFYEYYKKPNITISEGRQKNIVFIYAESLERTYFDETIFPGLIKGLRELETRSTYFTNIRQVRGTGWTVAGMTASQCGFPLFSPSHGNSMSGMDLFLSSAVCLGDLLNDKGYYLSYMGGANLDFAGKGKLFKTHGFAEVLGKNELLPRIKNINYKTSWGLYDDSLFDLLYERFIKLSESSEKFGLFSLTLDTHHPNGHPSKSCENLKYKDGSNPILNAVACSDYLISNFINKIIQSPYADKTVIVLMSDHLAMRNTASALLKTKDRRDLFMIIDPFVNKALKIETLGSTLDIGSTLLPFIGYKGNLGLGRNLLNDSKLVKADNIFIHTNLMKWKKNIMNFWDFPKIQNSLEINIDEKIIKIDKREFRIPTLIELDSKLASTLKFQFNKSSIHKTLIQHRHALSENKYFLLIDECKNVRKLDKNLDEKGFCLAAGKGKKNTKLMKIDKNILYTVNGIQKLLNIYNNFNVHRIAHAGGGVNNKTYTNSFEALNYNIKNGFQYFELDFSFSKDHKLVCLHDWKHSFKRSFGFETDDKVTLKKFNELVKYKSEFHKCTIDTLSQWMKQNPSAYIVTDIKENNIVALQEILKYLPDAKNRVIPQVYNPKNFLKIKNMGFEQMIWTLYRYSGSNNDVINWTKRFEGDFSVTMPKKRAESTLPKELHKLHIPTYVHTINSPQEFEKFTSNYKITEIYTDFLSL